MPITPEKLYDAATAERAVGKAALMAEFLLAQAIKDNRLFADLYYEIECLLEAAKDDSKATKDKLNELLLTVGNRVESAVVTMEDE